MIKFCYLRFDEDIAETVAKENANSSNLFICPNHRSLSDLQRKFQDYTTFQHVEFLTMDDYKLQILQSSLPLLKEDKRTLAFFASLSSEQKGFFHITGYFQAISLARRFFALFEELAEEMVTFKQVQEKLEIRESYQQWQIDNFQQLLNIRESYKDYITKRGFSDFIFLKNQAISGNHLSERYDCIIVVNQFYFTALEKELLPDNKTHIYLQIPQKKYDEKNMCCLPDFDTEALTNFRTQSIRNNVFSDEFSLKYHLFSQNFQPGTDTIIDTGILQKHLTAYNVNISSGTGFSTSFQKSSIYLFLKSFQTLLSELIFAEGKILISINSLLTVCSDLQFVKYYSKKGSTC